MERSFFYNFLFLIIVKTHFYMIIIMLVFLYCNVLTTTSNLKQKIIFILLFFITIYHLLSVWVIKNKWFLFRLFSCALLKMLRFKKMGIFESGISKSLNLWFLFCLIFSRKDKGNTIAELFLCFEFRDFYFYFFSLILHWILR